MQKATITTARHEGKISSNRKEDNFEKSYSVIPLDKTYDFSGVIYAHSIVDLRLYRTPSRAYACIWVSDRKSTIYLSGGGYAGGYGYHKASAAAQSAINDAGIVLDQNIAGVGDQAIEQACFAIAKAFYEGPIVLHVAHG